MSGDPLEIHFAKEESFEWIFTWARDKNISLKWIPTIDGCSKVTLTALNGVDDEDAED